MRKTPALAARILAGVLAVAAHAVPAQAPETPGAPSTEPPETAPAARPSAQLSVVPKSGEVLLNFQSADLQAVVKAMSQMTGRNMLIDPRVRGQVTIVSARPMPIAGAYQVFLSALKAQGFTAVEGPGDAVRIIPVAEAKAAAPVNEQDGPPRGGEQVITHVAIGQHVAVAQLQNVLRPLMSPTSQLSVYDPANALVITDYADNVRRLLRIIEKIDQPFSTPPPSTSRSWWCACPVRASPSPEPCRARPPRRSPRAATVSRWCRIRAPTASCCARTTRGALRSCARSSRSWMCRRAPSAAPASST